MERPVPKRRIFTVSKKCHSRGWTVSVWGNAVPVPVEDADWDYPGRAEWKERQLQLLGASVAHTSPGVVLMSFRVSLDESRTVEGARAQGLPGPWAHLSGEFHFLPKAVFETSKWNCPFCLCCRGGWGPLFSSAWQLQWLQLSCCTSPGGKAFIIVKSSVCKSLNTNHCSLMDNSLCLYLISILHI